MSPGGGALKSFRFSLKIVNQMTYGVRCDGAVGSYLILVAILRFQKTIFRAVDNKMYSSALERDGIDENMLLTCGKTSGGISFCRHVSEVLYERLFRKYNTQGGLDSRK